MDMTIKDKFINLWKRFFNGADFPISFYYTDKEDRGEKMKPSEGHRCVIGDLAKAIKGKSIYFDVDSVGCFGGKKYLGFRDELMPNFEYFLSYGIPGKLPGERYKKSPELVKEVLKILPEFKAPSKYIVFKRWDTLDELDNPDVVIFFAKPDVLSGLFTLANFDETERTAVYAPFAAGCGSIVQYPFLENKSHRPKAVLGMFDVSARPCVSEDVLTFSIPINKFLRMIDNMEESFLITDSWKKVHRRISGSRR